MSYFSLTGFNYDKFYYFLVRQTQDYVFGGVAMGETKEKKNEEKNIEPPVWESFGRSGRSEPTYSRIIGPEEYNRIITDEHLYIGEADDAIMDLVRRERDERGAMEVVEIGCGPGRILSDLAGIEGIIVTGVDHDLVFVEYAHEHISGIDIVIEEMQDYAHGKQVDVFVSQGVHHHVEKGEVTRRYLQNVADQLDDGGVYILGDEFIPEYSGEDERKVKATVWYSHIISEARKSGFDFLASEEAKTLLDDLHEGDLDAHAKSEGQIELVLGAVDEINDYALAGDISKAEIRAQELIEAVYGSDASYGGSDYAMVDNTMELSREDFKICESVFREEIEQAGLYIVESVRFGPEVDIGAMVVYTLRKG